MRYYYTDASNQPAGPCDLEQLKALAAEGKINDQTSVIPEGGQTWITYGALRGAAPTPPPPPRAASTFNLASLATILGDTVGKVLGLLSNLLSGALLQGSLKFAGHFGHFAVAVGAVLGLILATILATRMHSFPIFAYGGVGFVLAVAVAQFSAQRFMSAGTTIIANTPNRLSSKTFLECVGLFAILGAIGVFIGGLVASIQGGTVVPLIPAILITAYLLYFAMTALHPEELNVSISGEASAGEEAVSLLSFFCKVSLKLAPLFFFLFAVVGAIVTLLGIFDTGQGATQSLMYSLPIPPVMAEFAQNTPGQALVLIACLMPVLSYFFFLLSYLGLDLIRAILAVPGKLDALKKS